MAMGKLSKREQTIFAVTVVVLVGVGGYFGVYTKLTERWVQLNENIEQKEEMLQESKDSFNAQEKITKKYDDMVANLYLKGRESERWDQIGLELSNIMQEAGISPKNTKPESLIEEEQYQIYSHVYTDTETTMENLVRFLDLLEEKSKVSEILKIELDPEKGYRNFNDRVRIRSFKISRLVANEMPKELKEKS